MNHSTEPTIKLPSWVKTELRTFLDYVGELGTMLHLTMRGITNLKTVPSMLKPLLAAEEILEGRRRPVDMHKLEQDAALATREIDRGFPVLHAQAVVSLWGALEHYIRSLVQKAILNHPEAFQSPSLANLKVKLGEFHSLDDEDRSWYIMNLLEKELSSPLKQGANRFESILAAVSMAGSVPPDTGKTLFELHQTRNVLVHRAGIADAKFCAACPWVAVKPGEQLQVSHDKWSEFYDAVLDYCQIVFLRVQIENGQDDA